MKLTDLDHLRYYKSVRFKEETLPNGETVTIVCYMIADPEFWKLPLATECRGLVFDSEGNCISRPLQKFFNVNETEDTQLSDIKDKVTTQVADKRDGSMLVPVMVEGDIYWKTKKSFYSDVAVEAAKNVTEKVLNQAEYWLSKNHTPIYEYTSPDNRVVLDYGSEPSFVLLAVRNNETGEHVEDVTECPTYNKTTEELVSACENDEGYEGYVVSFADGTMVKFKTAWYLRHHRIRTELRVRDVADAVIDETLDDIKSFCATEGYNLTEILEIERQVLDEIESVRSQVETVVDKNKQLSDKDFAIANKDDGLFGLFRQQRKGKEPDYKKFWKKVYREHYLLYNVF